MDTRKNGKLQIVFLLLTALFFALCFITSILFRVLGAREVEARLALPEHKQEISQMLLKLADKLEMGPQIYDSRNDTRRLPAPEEKFNKVREEIERSYAIAIGYYRTGNMTLADRGFLEIVSSYEVFCNNYAGFSNPILFSRLFLGVIHKENPDLKLKSALVEDLAQSDGMEPLMMKSLLHNFQEMFTSGEVTLIQGVNFFRRFGLAEKIKSSLETGSRRFIYCASDDISRHCFLVNIETAGFSVHALDYESLESELSRIRETFTELNYRVNFIPDHELQSDCPDRAAGIAFNLALAPEVMSKIISGTRKKLVLWQFVLYLVWGIVIVAIGRYFILLKRLEERKDNFLHVVSHELKTPLSAIKIYADTLKRTKDVTKIAEYTSVISARCNQIQNMIANLIYFDKIASSGDSLLSGLAGSLEKRELSLHQLLSSICLDYANGFYRECKLDFPDNDFLICGDESIFRIIFSNLVENSFKYIKDTKVIVTVHGSGSTEGWELTYTDNGELAKDTDVSGLFGKYRRGETMGRSGLGLGLYIVKKLTEMMGGTVTAENAGTLLFRFRFGKGRAA
ncbi:MAG: HAMP domain-containing sensor histidine kinase [Candidatus Wallbacteria bacterium]|nr:HAMP domain-containing sensor histidine kinase [Candidatus Wallbacteria bacterium]